jgi:ribA/ribD-fused uncharacterized protein
MNRISSFKGDYRFLSNFWSVPIPLENVWYTSTEHAYQAAKTLDPGERVKIKNASSPGDAKKLGKAVKLRPDWEQVKLDYMRYLVWYKFAMYPDLGQKLLDTGTAELVEGNTWNDTFWGVCNGIGQNWLGKILMEVRDQVRATGPAKEAPKISKPVDKVYNDPATQGIFVFGSNTAGLHGGGAAKDAHEKYGAVWGIGEGPTGGCYAIPTKDGKFSTLSLDEIKKSVDTFVMFAWEHTDLKFFITRLGCGLAGYTDEQIAPFFADAPPNCELPFGWETKDDEP